MRYNRLHNFIYREGFRYKKKFLQTMTPSAKQKKICCIIGCQRSGTSLMLRIFDRDLYTQTFGEFSALSSQDDKRIRLDPLPMVKERLRKTRSSFLVLKPLVDSQNILEFLDYFNGSKAIWMYRNYRDVAASNLTQFGVRNGINDLRPIVKNENSNWRSEYVPQYIKELILNHFSENMNPYDAAVLFWCARNSLFFDLDMAHNQNIYLCKYADLVSSPEQVISTIYSNLNQKYPGPKIHQEVHTKSLRKGKDIKISPAVEQIASTLMSKLNTLNKLSNPHLSLT